MAQATTWRTTYRVPNTLPSDTEESVVGTQWHQDATSFLADMLVEAARRHGETWGVCNQIALVGLRHEDETRYDPRPDVMVITRPLPSGNDNAIHLDDAGVPLFVMEVASRSTGRNDVGDKRHAYEAIGIPEYISSTRTGTYYADLYAPGVCSLASMRRGIRNPMVGGTASPSVSRSSRRNHS